MDQGSSNHIYHPTMHAARKHSRTYNMYIVYQLLQVSSQVVYIICDVITYVTQDNQFQMFEK